MAISGATERPTCEPLRLRQGDVFWREETFGFVLYDRRSDCLYEGNALGRKLLQHLDAGVMIDALYAVISASPVVESDNVAADVMEFVEFLIQEDLVEKC